MVKKRFTNFPANIIRDRKLFPLQNVGRGTKSGLYETWKIESKCLSKLVSTKEITIKIDVSSIKNGYSPKNLIRKCGASTGARRGFILEKNVFISQTVLLSAFSVTNYFLKFFLHESLSYIKNHRVGWKIPES